MVLLHVPTADYVKRPAVIDEPEPRNRFERVITLEPTSYHASDQVCEPATPQITKGVLVEINGLDEIPSHTPVAVGELGPACGAYYEELKEIFEEDLIDWFEEVIPSFPESSVFSESPVSSLILSSPESPMSLLVPPSSCSPLFPPRLPLPLPQSASFQPCLRCCPSPPLHLQRAVRICHVSSGHQLIQHRGSPVSASSICDHHSTSAC